MRGSSFVPAVLTASQCRLFSCCIVGVVKPLLPRTVTTARSPVNDDCRCVIHPCNQTNHGQRHPRRRPADIVFLKQNSKQNGRTTVPPEIFLYCLADCEPGAGRGCPSKAIPPRLRPLAGPASKKSPALWAPWAAQGARQRVRWYRVVRRGGDGFLFLVCGVVLYLEVCVDQFPSQAIESPASYTVCVPSLALCLACVLFGFV